MRLDCFVLTFLKKENAKATLKKLGSLFKVSVAVRHWRRWQLWGDH